MTIAIFAAIALIAIISMAGQASAACSFSSNATSGISPLTIQFYDTSTDISNITKWQWNFGDGTTISGNTSDFQNPVHTYVDTNYNSRAGYYTVGLTIFTTSGNYGTQVSNYITIYLGAFFNMNVTSGMAPITVQFADDSPSNPTSWAWDFNNDGVIDSTDRNPVYTFTEGGTYKVNLTVSNATTGMAYAINRSLTFSNYNAYCDLTWNTICGPYAGSIYTDKWNPIRVSVKNNGPGRSAATTALVNSTDGFVGTVTIPEIESGKNIAVLLNDTTILPAGSPAVKYNILIDPDRTTNDTNRANNIRMGTAALTPKYNGYAGKRYMDGGSDVATVRTYELRGGILHSFGDSWYHGGGWTGYTVTWTPADLSLPEGATVVDAWLYIPYCWDNTHVAPDNLIVKFNGVDINYTNWYSDQSNGGGYAGYLYGMMTYNVTSLFQNGSANQAFLDHKISGASAFAGFSLVVVYADANASRKQIFVNEEFDALGDSLTASAYGTNETEATAYVPFTGMTIETASAMRANLTTFVPWGSASEGGEGNLYFNDNQIGYHVWYYGPRAQGASDSAQVAVDTRDVRQYLTATGNVAAVQSSTNDATPLIVAAQDFLVVEYPDAFPGKAAMPTDPDHDGLLEDLNGNGRIDFEDVVTYFQNMSWIRGNAGVGVAPYDYNGNGLIDFADLVQLFNERMG